MAYVIDLTGKNAIVTGGTRGIGLATSQLLAGCGARVTMIYRSDDEAAQSALESLPGEDHWAVKGDLGDPAQAQAIAAECAAQAEGGVDFVVLNAGLMARGGIADVSAEEWRRPFDVNVHGHAAVLRGVSPAMNAGGAVVFISSGAGHDPLAGLGAYGASKAAVNQMAAVLAQEWGPRGVRVNVVSPGHTSRSPIDYDHLSESQRTIVESTALRRIGTTEDVAKAVLFFLSDLSGFVTGQTIRCNGGRL